MNTKKYCTGTDGVYCIALMCHSKTELFFHFHTTKLVICPFVCAFAFSHFSSQPSAPVCIWSAHKLSVSSGFQPLLLSGSKVRSVDEESQRRLDTKCTCNNQPIRYRWACGPVTTNQQ